MNTMTKKGSTLKRIILLMKSYWYLVVICLIFGEVVQLLSAFEPIITQRIIDTVFTQQKTQALGTLLLYLVLVVVGSVFFDGVRDYYMNALAAYTMADMRRSLLNSLQKKTFSFYDRNKVGQLVSNMTIDVEATGLLIGRWTEDFLETIMGIITIILLIYRINPTMTLIALIPMPFIFFFTRGFVAAARPLMRAQQEVLGAIAIKMQQNIVGMKVIRTFEREEEAVRSYKEEGDKYLENAVFLGKITALNTSIGTYILTVTVAAVYIYGANLVLMPNSVLTIGQLYMFSSYVTRLAMPARRLSNIAVTYTTASAGAERVFAVLDEEPDVKNKADAKELKNVEGQIKFQHVDFEYIPDRPVLNDIDFTANSGETIAILGPTGSGKSSLTYLIPRFYDATRGGVLIDGVDIRDVTLKSLRQHVGVVLQDIFLFTGTIKSNICFGKPEATQEEVETVAKLAKAHDFIMAFPKGYDTLIGERGITLSGGQKQRIAIARTLITNPKILIMDDSLSNVDAKTEQDIQQALNLVMRGRTTFVIAQRLSTIKNAHRIMVLEKGRIAELGTHEELVALDGIYRRIYESQFEALNDASAQGNGSKEVSTV